MEYVIEDIKNIIKAIKGQSNGRIRGQISIIVFLLIFFLSEIFLGSSSYNESIRLLAAVIGGGCYWIGSNKAK